MRENANFGVVPEKEIRGNLPVWIPALGDHLLLAVGVLKQKVKGHILNSTQTPKIKLTEVFNLPNSMKNINKKNVSIPTHQ